MCCKILIYKCSGVCVDRIIFFLCGINLVKKIVIIGYLYINLWVLEIIIKYIWKNSIILFVLSIICDYKEVMFRINNIFIEVSEEFFFRISVDIFRKV